MNASNYISLLALLVSLFTFYWTTIRKNSNFTLVRIDNINVGLLPQFSLINGGSDSLLITSVSCGFVSMDGTRTVHPRLISGKQVFSLEPRKPMHYITNFDAKDLNESLAEGGEFIKNGSFDLYFKDMIVIIDWIDLSGVERSSNALISRYGIDENGRLSMHKPLKKHHDLYKKCRIVSN